MRFAERMGRVAASRTVRLTERIHELRREGREILDLAVGEPHFPPPPEVIRATAEALSAGHTRYGPVGGLPALRSAVARQFEDGVSENILVTNGAKQALFALFQVICQAGDEVILSAPCWVSFAEQIRLAGGEPVLVPAGTGAVDPSAVSAAVSNRTVAVLVNSPSNPTGAVADRQTWAALADLARERNLLLISDEAYADFVFTDPDVMSAWELAAVRDRLVVVRSFSKSFSMTGFRVGYAVAPTALIRELAKHQSHATGNVCTFAQHGALAALSLPPETVAARRDALRELGAAAHARLSRWFEVAPPRGAFYLFPDISQRLRPGETAEDFAADLLEQTGVALTPGEAFGGPGHLRISFAVTREVLERGLARLHEFMEARS
jgi:aspartate aminotransferase